MTSAVCATAGARVTDPDLRLTAYVFERMFGEAPDGLRHVPGALTLLGGGEGHALTVGLRWGVTVALAPGPTDLRSMNHHSDRYTDAQGEPPDWAAPALRALTAHKVAGARMVVNRELPLETGLLNGGETYCVVSQALHDLHGTEAAADCDPTSRLGHLTALHARPGQALLLRGDAVERLPCDLAKAGLRLLVMDLGIDRTLPVVHSRLLALTAAAALRAGDLGAFGALLSAGHVRGEFAFDLALDTACGAGALGGLAIGRCVVALAPVRAVPQIRKSVQTMLHGLGERPPRFLTAVPSGPRA
ncbi:hypothetical protein [Actinomadura sp. SCN-SB]|uniref:hypothetical protein n=1 Tax=Actinomadura sp. SCN-SB TaxID=3373092 RepID=UPI0037505FA1